VRSPIVPRDMILIIYMVPFFAIGSLLHWGAARLAPHRLDRNLRAGHSKMDMGLKTLELDPLLGTLKHWMKQQEDLNLYLEMEKDKMV